MILNGCRDLALPHVRRFWMRTLAAGQSEVERVSRRTVDVVAMLYPTPVVVIGRTRHRQQRRPLLLAQRVRLGGGGGTWLRMSASGSASAYRRRSKAYTSVPSGIPSSSASASDAGSTAKLSTRVRGSRPVLARSS